MTATNEETTATQVAAATVVATTPAPANENWFERLEDQAKADVLAFELYFENDVWPYVKEFLSLLLSQAGHAALVAAVADVGDLVAGNYAPVIAAVTGAAVSAAEANANADAQKALQDAQAANTATGDAITAAVSAVGNSNAPDGEKAN